MGREVCESGVAERPKAAELQSAERARPTSHAGSNPAPDSGMEHAEHSVDYSLELVKPTITNLKSPANWGKPLNSSSKAWPSSPIIRPSGQAPGFGNGMRWLARRVRLDRLATGGTQAVLPTVPALKNVVTAQAGGRPSIRGRF